MHVSPVAADGDERPRRGRGDRGSSFVAALVIMFSVTGGAALYLAREVNQRVSDRSALQSIAFQGARAGAQQIDLASVRSGSDDPLIEPGRAEVAASEAVARLAEQYEIEVRIEEQHADAALRTWTVVLRAPRAGRAGDEWLTATGVAHVETGS